MGNSGINPAAIEATVFEQKRLLAFGVLRRAVQMRNEQELRRVIPECEAAGVERAALKMATTELDRVFYNRRLHEVVHENDDIYNDIVQRAREAGVDAAEFEVVERERLRYFAEVELARAREAGTPDALQAAIKVAKQRGVASEAIDQAQE